MMAGKRLVRRMERVAWDSRWALRTLQLYERQSMKVHRAAVPIEVRERRDSWRGLVATVTARTRSDSHGGNSKRCLIKADAGHGTRPDHIVIGQKQSLVGQLPSSRALRNKDVCRKPQLSPRVGHHDITIACGLGLDVQSQD